MSSPRREISMAPPGPRLWQRLVQRFAAWWDSLEFLFRRAERRSRKLEAEVRQAGLNLLDRVDDLPFVPTLVRFPAIPNQYYGHGAFMGAAPALLAEEKWRRILAFLMPDVYLDVSDAVRAGATTSRVIPMFENNPVMCAFGVWHGEQRRADWAERHPNDLAGMEWDVFLDGQQIDRWEAGNAQEKANAIRAIVDTMVIAHASTADTVQEAAGVCQYEDVCRTPKTHLGGVRIHAWLDLFGRALELAGADALGPAIAAMSTEPRVQTGEVCSLFTFVQPRSVDAALAPWRALTGRRHFSIVLEIKSLRSTPALMREIVAEVNARGLHVASVCSFNLAEVEGLSQFPQVIGSETLPGPREIQFFHWAGDVQGAAERGALKSGQSLLFNGATLLEHTPDHADGPYRILTEVIEELDELRRERDLSIGVYVQEGDADAAAVRMLSHMVERWPATFDLGFAWGGLVDEGYLETDGSDRRGLGSQAMLGWVGSARKWVTRAPAETADDPA